jgi:DNA-directed RNA polymerase specialized sigma24 family protein
MKALRQIPASQRQALALHYLFDLSVDEIAVETGAARGNVKVLAFAGTCAPRERSCRN